MRFSGEACNLGENALEREMPSNVAPPPTCCAKIEGLVFIIYGPGFDK